MKRYFIIGITLTILLTLLGQTTIANAPISIIDDLTDVSHITFTDGNQTAESDYEKSYLDIFKITHYVIDDKIELYMVINGTINDNDTTSYVVWYNTTNATYKIDYQNGKNYGYAEGKPSKTESDIQRYENTSFTKSDNVITATYELLDETTQNEFWGYAIETKKDEKDILTEAWVDFIPQSYNEKYNIPDNGNNGEPTDNNDKKDQNDTPGFNSILFFTALISLLFIIIVKKQKS